MRVSDHAVLQYYKRILKLDIPEPNEIRKMISLNGNKHKTKSGLRNGKFYSEDGSFIMVVANNVIVTILGVK